MTPKEIKAALFEKDVKQVAIANDVGFSPSLVNEVIRGTRRNEKIEVAIAGAIGKPVEEVFPVGQPTSAQVEV